MSKIKFASGSIPAEATQNNLIQEKEQIVIEDVKQEEGYQDKRILRALPEKSSKFSRSFALNDGTIKSVYSSSPINYYDEQEKVWKELDSTLQDEGDNYVSNLGKYKAKIKKNGEVAGVTVGDGNSYVEWQFLGTKIEGNKYCLKDKKCKPNVKVDNYKKDKDIFSYGKLKYLSCDDGVDIEYITQGNGVKENIIVNKKSEEYKYYFSLKTSGLKVKIDEQGDNIIFYTEKEGKEEVELMIPAPYMYDNAQEYSDEVLFELTKVKEGEYIFTVEADANWINQEGRAFPITVDPQIVAQGTKNNISIVKKYKYVGNEDTSEYDYGVSTIIPAGTNNDYYYFSTLSLNINDFSIDKEKLIRAKLYIKVNYLPTDGPILIDGVERKCVQDELVEIDLFNKIKNSTDGNVTVLLDKASSNGVVFFYNGGALSPYFEFAYINSSIKEKTIREYSNLENVSHNINLVTKEVNTIISDLSNDSLPFDVPIVHVFKESIKDYGLGYNFRLNLHDKLLKVSSNLLTSNYVYEDLLGDLHSFDEIFYYYNDSGNKMFIQKNDVIIENDLSLYINVSDKRYKVYKEEYSTSGLKASTQLETFKRVDLLIQKNEEIAEKEGYLQTYKVQIEDYLIWNGINDSATNKLDYSNYDTFYNLLSNLGENYLLTQSEYAEIKELLDEERTAQLRKIKTRQADTILHLKGLYKAYSNYLFQLNNLKKTTPINYLSDGEKIKGYNEEGILVVICDNNENVVWVNYDAENRIISIDYNDKEIYRFDYVSDKLICIASSNGDTVNYQYTAGNLSKITYSNGTVIDITYNSKNIITSLIDRSVGKEDRMVFERNGSFKGIRTYGVNRYINETVEGLEEVAPSIELCGELYTISDGQTLILQTQEPQSEYYLFDENGNKTHYFVEKNNLVISAERYTYLDFLGGRVEYANRDKLNIAPFSTSFDFGQVSYEETVNNRFYNIETETKYTVFAEDRNTTEITTYFYNVNNDCVKQQTTFQMVNGEEVLSYTQITKYFYDDANRVIKTETFVEGEEKEHGVDIQESVYNEKGDVVKQIYYNTLDASSKRYSEEEINDLGQVIKEYDQSGQNAVFYEYLRDEKDFTRKILPNGSSFAYGKEKGIITSITQSDDLGEESSNQTAYNYGEVVRHISGNAKVNFAYESKRRVSELQLNDAVLFNNVYVDHVDTTNDTVETTYASRESNNYVDKFLTEYNYKGDVVSVKYANTLYTNVLPTYITQSQFTYDAEGKITSVLDGVTNQTHSYEYDIEGREVLYSCGNYQKAKSYTNYGEINSEAYTFTSTSQNANNLSYAYEYSNDSKRSLLSIGLDGLKENYTYDSLQRLKECEQVLGDRLFSQEYCFYKNGDRATDVINAVYYKKDSLVEDKFTYTYDSMKNVTSVSKNGNKIKEYKYDTIGRLVYENNIDIGKEISYNYDRQGNILSKKVNGEFVKYTYDKYGFNLLSYGNQGFTYDKLGNLKNLNSTYYSLTWDKVNLLSRANASSHNISFSYNAKGVIVNKTINGGNTYYSFVYDKDKLIRLVQTGYSSITLDFIYGQKDLIGFIYNGATYLYQKNIFGDIVKIIDASGETAVEYAYTAFGECFVLDTTTNASIANLNPFRYRGYFYDTNLNLYYLKSRFYNPVIGRFITPDNTKYLSPDKINGLNLHTYCYNNPINYIDPNGTDAILIIDYNYKGGLPIVGHALVVLQGDGKWLLTEYGKGWDRCTELAKGVVDKYLKGKQFDLKAFRKDFDSINLRWFFSSQIYLEGNYTNSYNLATSLNGFGKYNLFQNNCLDYVQYLLKAGKNKYDNVQQFINKDTRFVPSGYYSALKKEVENAKAQELILITKAIFNAFCKKIKNRFRKIRSLFKW